MKYLFLLFLIISCGRDNESYSSNFEKQYSSFGESENIAILAHGIWSDESYWQSGAALNLKNSLIDNGFEVITFTYPETTKETFINNGLAYRKDFIHHIKWIISDLKLKQEVKRIIIGGFSFGGLHAMVAASDIKEIKEYFAIMPSMDISLVLKGVNSSNFMPNDSVLFSKKGLVISGIHDSVVDYKLSESWAKKMNHSVEHYLIDSDHRINLEVVDIIKNKYPKY